jgi:hypothetical protein
MNTKIIAFSGRKQSGKSTSAEFTKSILEARNISTKIYSFADPLKQDICINILNLTYDQCYGSDEDKNSLTNILWENIPGYNGSLSGYMTARQVMEVLGTSIFRKIKNDIWVRATLNTIKRENFDIAIIADCRFPNEVDDIINSNGFVIRLCRDSFRSNAEAETALDKQNYNWSNFNLIIDNNNMAIEEKNTYIQQFLINTGII